MRWAEITTMEHLWMDGNAEQGAVLQHGDKVLVCGLTYRGFEAAVYEFIETAEETGLGYIECRIQLLEKNDAPFDEGGQAMAWCFSRV